MPSLPTSRDPGPSPRAAFGLTPDAAALEALFALLPSPVVAIDAHGCIAGATPLAAQALGAADVAALVGGGLAARVGEAALAWALGDAGGVRTLSAQGLDGVVRHVEMRVEPRPAGPDAATALRMVEVRLSPDAAAAPAPAPTPAPSHARGVPPILPPLLRDSPIGAGVTRCADGLFCDVNDAFLALVGRSREEVIGRGAVEMGLWASAEAREAYLGTPGTVHVETGRVRQGNGDEREVRAWTHALDAGTGRAPEFLVWFMIADDRRDAAEGALAAERSFTRALVETAGQSVAVTDGGDRLVYANAAFADLTGVPVGDLLGRPIVERIAPAYRTAYETELARRRVGGRGVYETEILHADGASRTVLVTAIPHPSGEAGASIALLTDLTDLHAAQRAAEAQRAFYEDLVSRLPIGIVVTDAAWRFRFANMLAIPDAGLRAWSIGRTFEEIAAHVGLTAGRRERYEAARRCVEETGEATEWIEETTDADGGVRHTLERIESLRDASGEPGYLGYTVDVTERVRGERVAEEARRFYETILDELSIPVAVFEATGRLLYANSAALPRAALREILVGRFLPPAMARQMGVRGDGRDRLLESVATGERMEWEETRTRAGAPPRHLLASLTPMADASGTVRHLVASSIDVTAQRASSAAVERMRAYYERILRRLPIELYIVRPDGTFDFLNPASVRDAETRAWLVGRRNVDYARRRGFEEAPFAARDAWVESVIADPRPAMREEAIDLPGRPTRHMLRALLPVFGTLMRDDEADDDADNGAAAAAGGADRGDLAFLIGYGVDLTERVAAAAQQESQRAFYESVLDNLPISLAVFDRQGRMLYISPEVVPEAHLRAEAIGKTNEDLARLRGRPTENARARDAWIRGVIESGVMGSYEERLASPDGDVRDLLRTVVPVFDADGGVDYVVGYTLDVTERKRYESSLLAAKEEAEELGRLKSAFLANMSHEIRTPLAGIIGFADVLVDELDEPHREAAQLIRESGVRLLETLNSVLDMARLEANAVEVDLMPVDLRAEMDAAVHLFRATAAARGLAVVIDGPLAPVVARVDPQAYHRVLVNLVSNAVKFTDAGEVRLSVAAEGGEAVVRVRDTGIGMDAAFLPHAFDEFQQESSGLTRSHQGSGLGLAITRHLVGLMHGRIEVESEKGVGSCFTIRLPLAA